MSTAVCTLFEGHYHFGVGALINSLYQHGFRGTIYAGYRGELPPWAVPMYQREDFQEFCLQDGCAIRFIPLQTSSHFANYKPHFMLQIWEEICPEAEQLFYFDPDIVVKCRWRFFESWADNGVALCEEITNGHMPANHPVRLSWNSLMQASGYRCVRELNQYFNSGFVGLKREHIALLYNWRRLLNNLGESGQDLISWMPGDRSNPFYAVDQDVLNLATMVTDTPLSTIGPEGMDFVHGGFTMSHAVGTTKPWKKNMIIEALNGKGPSYADNQFYNYTESPIRLFDKRILVVRRASLRMGALIGRFIERR